MTDEVHCFEVGVVRILMLYRQLLKQQCDPQCHMMSMIDKLNWVGIEIKDDRACKRITGINGPSDGEYNGISFNWVIIIKSQ